MPTETQNTIRLDNPAVSDDDIRKKSSGEVNYVGTVRLGTGISGLLALKKGGSGTVIKVYIFDKEKWDIEKATAWINEHVNAIRSSINDTPKIDNGVWIPFLKNGQLAQNSRGQIFRLTKEAIDNNYKDYLGGYFNINHSDKIPGQVIDVKRDGEFAYFKADNLNPDTIETLNSKAYRGVSQESINLSSAMTEDNKFDVKSFRGMGISFLLYPKRGGCPLDQGCGMPLHSSIADEDSYLFSVTGDSMETEYTKADMKSMLAYMKDHPDMMDEDMLGMMKGMMGKGMMKSSISNPDLNLSELISTIPPAKMEELKATIRKEIMTETKDVGADALLKSEIDALKKQVDALTSENAGLKSSVAQKDEEIKKIPDMIKSSIEAALKAHDEHIKSSIEMEVARKDLFSVMKKETADKFLASNPGIEIIRSTIDALKESTPQAHAGAGAGEIIQSAVKKDEFNYDDARTQFWGAVGIKKEVK